MKTKILIALLLLIPAFLGSAIANPGDLDPTFGTGGIAIDFPSNYPCWGMYPRGLTLQPDAKVLVVGKLYDRCQSYGYENDPVISRRVLLRRYNPNGTPDLGFGLDGTAVLSLPSSNGVAGEAYDVAVQPDGRIVVAGWKQIRTATRYATIWRFTPNGELDQTFGDSGVVVVTSQSGNTARKVAVWNGKIVVAGNANVSGNDAIWVRRFNSDGSPDTAFASSGLLTTNISPDVQYIAFAVNAASGQIFVGGHTQSGDAAVVKFFSSGTLFTNFGSFGTAILPDCTPGGGYTPTYPIAAIDLRFQSTGKILVASRMSYGGWAETPGIHRLTAGGGVDATFQDTTMPGSCNAIVQGSTWIRDTANDYFYSGYKRFFPDGSKDATFAAGPIASIYAQVQPADGKIVYFNSDLFLTSGKSYADSRVKLFRVLP